MLKKLIVVSSIALLSGCAQQPAKPALDPSKIHPTPVCKGEVQCSAMWGRAVRSLPALTRIRLMTVTDSYLQTYPVKRVGYMNGTAYKQKVGEDSYKIVASFDCGGNSWCADLSNRALDLFNVDVQGFDR